MWDSISTYSSIKFLNHAPSGRGGGDCLIMWGKWVKVRFYRFITSTIVRSIMMIQQTDHEVSLYSQSNWLSFALQENSKFQIPARSVFKVVRYLHARTNDVHPLQCVTVKCSMQNFKSSLHSRIKQAFRVDLSHTVQYSSTLRSVRLAHDFFSLRGRSDTPLR